MWMTEWRAISARIQALIEAGTFFLQTIDHDASSASNLVIENAHDTFDIIGTFLQNYESQFQPEQYVCVFLFLKNYKNDLMPPSGNPSGFSGVTSVVTYLASFRAQFEYLIRDNVATVRSLVIRAFEHLQRTIVVDEVTRQLWKQKFDDGETACEALGSCHLLFHGVWSFKTSAAGERTDLVLGEQLDITSGELQRASSGLVLTEWKVVRTEIELDTKLEEAYQQAKLYRQGILAGFEVASPRYLIMVSEDRLKMPSARQDGEVIYEHRNIAVSPTSPSKFARKVANS